MFPCAHCGNELPEGATFCNQCWRTVDANAAGSVAAGGFTMPGPGTDPTVVGPAAVGPAGVGPAVVDPASPEPPGPRFESPPGHPASAPAPNPWDTPPNPWAGGAQSPAPPSGQGWGSGQPPPAQGWPASPPPPPAYGYAAPAYGYPQSPYSAPGYYGSPVPKTNGMAIASLVCSLCGFVTCISPIAGIVLGHIALSQIKRDGSTGRGLAIAGLVIGYLFVLGIVAFIVLLVAGRSTTY